MIALTYLGNDKREHGIQINDHEELTCMRIALENAGFQITRVWVVSS